MPERTLILVKPDGVHRGLIGAIIGRFEARGLRVAALKMLRFDRELARKHYAEHVEMPFYPPLEDFITSGVCVAMVLEADDAIAMARNMVGATNHLNAAPGTIRGDWAYSGRENLVHASDSLESAAREIPLFFAEEEIL